MSKRAWFPPFYGLLLFQEMAISFPQVFSLQLCGYLWFLSLLCPHPDPNKSWRCTFKIYPASNHSLPTWLPLPESKSPLPPAFPPVPSIACTGPEAMQLPFVSGEVTPFMSPYFSQSKTQSPLHRAPGLFWTFLSLGLATLSPAAFSHTRLLLPQGLASFSFHPDILVPALLSQSYLFFFIALYCLLIHFLNTFIVHFLLHPNLLPVQRI